MSRRIVQVLGAGGHAKVVIATLRACGYDVIAAWDDTRERWGHDCLGVGVQGAIEEAGDVPSVIAIGDNRARQRLARLELAWVTAAHPSAAVHDSVRLGTGAIVFAGAVIQPEAVIGDHVIVNTAASIDHDCRIGDFAHVGPGVHLCGNVAVGEGTLIGVGACARPGAQIGTWAIVGAGAAVVAPVDDGTLVIGVPARRPATR